MPNVFDEVTQQTYSFPDGATPDQMKQAMGQYRAKQPTTSAGQVAAGVEQQIAQAKGPNPTPFLDTMKQIPEMAAHLGAFTGGNIAGQAGATAMGLPPLAAKAVGAGTGALAGTGSDWLSDHLSSWFKGKVPDEHIPSLVDDFKKNLVNAGITFGVEGVAPAVKEIAGYAKGTIPTAPTESWSMNRLTGRTALKEGALGVGGEAKVLQEEAVEKATEAQGKERAQLQQTVGEAQQEASGVKTDVAAEHAKDLAEKTQALTEKYTPKIKQEEAVQTVAPDVDPIRLAKGEAPEMTPDGVALPPLGPARLRVSAQAAVHDPGMQIQKELSRQYEQVFKGQEGVEIPTEALASRAESIKNQMLEFAKSPVDGDIRKLFGQVEEAVGAGADEPRGPRQTRAGVQPPWRPRDTERQGIPFTEEAPTRPNTFYQEEQNGQLFRALTDDTGKIARVLKKPINEGEWEPVSEEERPTVLARLFPQKTPPAKPTDYDPTSPWAQAPDSWRPEDETPPPRKALTTTPKVLFGLQSEAARIMRQRGTSLRGSDRWALGNLNAAIHEALDQHVSVPEDLKLRYREFKDQLGPVLYNKDFHDVNQTEIADQLFNPSKANSPLRARLLYGNADPAQRKTLTSMLGEWVTQNPNALKGQKDFFAPIFEEAYGKVHPLANPDHMVYVNDVVDSLSNLMASNTPAAAALQTKYQGVGVDLKEKYGKQYLKEIKPVIKQLEPYFQKELGVAMGRGKTTAEKVDAVQQFFGQPTLKEQADFLQQYLTPDPVQAGSAALAKKFPEVRIVRGEEGVPFDQQTIARIPAATDPKGAMERSAMLGISKKAERSWMGTYTERILPITIAMGATDVMMGGALSTWHAGMLATGAGLKAINPLRMWQQRALQDPAAAKAFVNAITTFSQPKSTDAIMRMSFTSGLANLIQTYNAAKNPLPVPKIQSKGPYKPDSTDPQRHSSAEKHSTDLVAKGYTDISKSLAKNTMTQDDLKGLLENAA